MTPMKYNKKWFAEMNPEMIQIAKKYHIKIDNEQEAMDSYKRKLHENFYLKKDKDFVDIVRSHLDLLKT